VGIQEFMILELLCLVVSLRSENQKKRACRIHEEESSPPENPREKYPPLGPKRQNYPPSSTASPSITSKNPMLFFTPPITPSQ
jgi:hypothetical protein